MKIVRKVINVRKLSEFMFKDVDEFFESESDFSQRELFQINKDLDNLAWLNIIGEIHNKEYLKKVSLKNKKASKNIMNFGKDIKKFSKVLKYIYGEEEGKNKLNHELKHAKVCEKYGIDYFFGIMKFNDLRWIKSQPIRTIWSFVYPFDNDSSSLKPRERILFNIKLNEAPDHMSSGDYQGFYFWEAKLKEFDSNYTSQ